MKKLIALLFTFSLFCGTASAQVYGIPGLDYNANATPQIINEITGDNVLTTLAWTSLAPSTAVSRSCVTYINVGGNDYIYQFGGGSGAQYTTVARYDVAANTWSTGFASIPSNMSAATAVTVGDKIYLFGGESAGGLGRTYMYDPAANTWTTKANMLTLVTDALVVKFEDNNYIYVVGGGDGLFGTNVQSSVQLYNIATNTYTACTPLPAAVSMMGGGILNYTIIATGGWTGSTGSAVTYKGVINPGNMSQITWTPVANYPAGGVTRMASFPVTLGTYPSAAGIFCTGGAVNGSTLTGATHLFNFCTDAWEVLTPNLAQARSNFKGSGKMDNVVHVVAGFTTVAVGTHDKATLTAIAGNCYTPIPVELISFNANVNNGIVELTWITATELNNQGFEIQRSAGSEFEKIGFVDGYGTTTETKVYSFADRNVNHGSYSYRLKQIDFDGTFAYSDVINVEVNPPAVFSLEQNYPNPFNPSTMIKFTLAADSKVSLKVFNVLGQEIASLIDQDMSAGTHTVDFNAEGINSGVYFYKIDATGLNGSEFSDVKKMILTK
jgi:hypothetical protein